MERRQHKNARLLGKQLSTEAPGSVIERLIGFEREADVAGLSRYPHTTPTVFEEIASRTEDPGAWLKAAECVVERKFASYFRPFCESLVVKRAPTWEESVRQLLTSENLNHIMALSCLRNEVPDELLEAAASYAGDIYRSVLNFETRFFTSKAKLLLLGAEDVGIRGAVVEGQARKGLTALAKKKKMQSWKLL